MASEPELDDFGLPIVKLVVRSQESDSEDGFHETATETTMTTGGNTTKSEPAPPPPPPPAATVERVAKVEDVGASTTQELMLPDHGRPRVERSNSYSVAEKVKMIERAEQSVKSPEAKLEPGVNRSRSISPSPRSIRGPSPAPTKPTNVESTKPLATDQVTSPVAGPPKAIEPSKPSATEADTTTVEPSNPVESPKPPRGNEASTTSPYLPSSPPQEDSKSLPISTTTATTLPEPTSKILEKAGLPDTLPSYTEHHPHSVVSEWSHQQSVPQPDAKLDSRRSSGEWQEMPAFAPFDIYNDDGKLIAREHVDSDDEGDGYMGGAGKGYTRVTLDEDAQSATSMDENTKYLFKDGEMDDETAANPLAQLETTKDLLTEGERVAYVGLCRLGMVEMVKELELIDVAKRASAKKSIGIAVEHMKMWSQIIMVRLYKHMDITPAEQIMIEQLAEHGVLASDLTPTLMRNARVNNPMAKVETESPSKSPPADEEDGEREWKSTLDEKEDRKSLGSDRHDSPPPPAYEEHMNDEMPDVQMPSDLPDSKTIDLDIRWTVLCDLFLVLISDSVYDARSRVLLERVGKHLQVEWSEICKFEKRVTDALEMQEAADQNWNETEILEDRRKKSRNRRYAMMGLATIGGGLVIGLSAGLLAPVIGAGLAAGFTTIGVAGTGSFLAGAGGAAVITTTAAISGSTIAAKASGVRTQSVSTFEFRPLHNNKRLNLIVTVSGWMIGNEDDVRLPYSTIDPIMGDIYSLLWEPEMLKSMGQTINLLATEVLTQSLQQVLGSTILVSLMAALQLPVVLTKLSYLLDNPWSVSLDRAWASGLILADTLIHRNLGIRPVTLVGYSLGARVIFSCLLELSKRNAHGLVQNVYMFGSPIVSNRDDYLLASSMVRGRFVNGYATNDWILGYLFRATSGGIGRVAGLKAVDDVPGLENHDVTSLVNGHMAYRGAVPKLLRTVGWQIQSDEFTEIEDPDPDSHRERQVELINDIEEARKELAKEPAKRKWGWLTRNKDLAKKKEWETYEESNAAEDLKNAEAAATAAGEDKNKSKDGDGSILFDVEAIRRELALGEIEARESGGGGGSPAGSMRKTSSASLAAPRPSLLHTNSKYDSIIEPPVWSAKAPTALDSGHTRNKSSNASLKTTSPYASVRNSMSYENGVNTNTNGSSTSLQTRPYSYNPYNETLPTPSKSPIGRPSHDIHSYNEYDYDETYGDGIQMSFGGSLHDSSPVEMTFGSSPPKPPPKENSNGWASTSTSIKSKKKSPVLAFEPPSPRMEFAPESPKMEFEPSSPKMEFEPSPIFSKKGVTNGDRAVSMYGGVGTTGPAASIVPKRHSSLAFGRPGLTQVKSTPPMGGNKNKNPWADEEEDDDVFGHEGGMTMSFE